MKNITISDKDPAVNGMADDPNVIGSLPPKSKFVDLLIENVECALRDDGIYFADSLRYTEDGKVKAKWFEKMIEEYKRQ